MRILVTGASRGIGRAICQRLARDAAGQVGGKIHLAICASAHPDELDGLAEELRALGADVLGLHGDLADAAAPQRFIAETVAAFGGLDGLVSNAGIGWVDSLLGLRLEDWQRLFDVNLRATWLLGKAAHPALKDSRGCIVTIGSMSGVQPQVGMGAYSVSKSALIMLSRLMAQEWADDGIRVNCVSPGWVHTPMTADTYADADLKARREAFVPQHRIAEPLADIAGAVAFFLGPDSGYATGQNLVVDGGLSDSILKQVPARKT